MHQHIHNHSHSDEHSHSEHHNHGHHTEHGHSHGMIDPSIVRSKEGVRVVSLSLIVLFITALLQIIVFYSTNSLSLLADIIHNVGGCAHGHSSSSSFFDAR
jgi:Co/Zn/Cd efflux system component